MPASIRVESGISAGTKYWIDRPVLRIGSDPQCEICLPTAELAPHALTLEFRDGNYRAYNRSAAPVRIGTKAVQPNSTGIWDGDEAVQLPGDVRLLLEIDGDPRPSPRPETRIDDGYQSDDAAPLGAETESTGEAAAKKKSGSMIQLAVIGFCVLGMAAMLTMNGGSEAPPANRPTFEQIVGTSLAADKNDPARLLLPKLQYAQAALVRGHAGLAKQQFLRLRNQLIRQAETVAPKDQESLRRMLSYVEYRLSLLQ